MALSSRPEVHAERDQIVAALTAYMALATADPALVALEAAIFASARVAYVAARADYQEKTAAARRASAAADEADAEFDRKVRRLVASVVDEDGRANPRLFADMMGGLLPSELTSLPYRTEVQKAGDLLRQLRVRTDLDIDAARLDALEAALTALDAATTEDEEAGRAARAAGSALATARDEFDRAYGKLVRAWLAVVGETATFAVLPRFVRREASAAADEPAEPAP